jgi:hypothetical protein
LVFDPLLTEWQCLQMEKQCLPMRSGNRSSNLTADCLLTACTACTACTAHTARYCFCEPIAFRTEFCAFWVNFERIFVHFGCFTSEFWGIALWVG